MYEIIESLFIVKCLIIFICFLYYISIDNDVLISYLDYCRILYSQSSHYETFISFIVFKPFVVFTIMYLIHSFLVLKNISKKVFLFNCHNKPMKCLTWTASSEKWIEGFQFFPFCCLFKKSGNVMKVHYCTLVPVPYKGLTNAVNIVIYIIIFQGWPKLFRKYNFLP